MRRRAKPAKAKVKARLPVARKPRKIEVSGSRQLEKLLAEAFEQQAATSEILRVISSSQTDVRSVFETIAANSLRLCDAKFSAIFRFDGELIHLAALHNVNPEGADAYRGAYPMPPGRGSGAARAILTRSVVHISDVREDPEYVLQGLAQTADFRSNLSVPMLRDGHPIGAITVTGEAARPFPDKQVKLLQTFADQAVIAIENVRLFKELEARNADLTEALEQQTATAEILRVISTSPTDLQPVLDTVVASAARFCGAYDATMLHLDRGSLRLVAHHGSIPVPVGLLVPVVRGTVAGRAVLEREAVHVADAQAEAEKFPEGSAIAREQGFRTVLSVPLLREGAAIGTIVLRRAEVNPFMDKQIKLLQTFADQAVIAIENVRLFTELEARNRELTVALDQQTATSEILRVISQSPTDVQPVFDTIVESAVRLCSADVGNVTRFDGEWVHMPAIHADPAGAERLRRMYPARPSGALASLRSIRDRAVVHIPDVLEDEEHQAHDAGMAAGFRAMFSVPMLRDGQAIGSLTVGRAAPGRFSDSQIALLQTFADQAVIAIENVRLFKELEARNADLTEALEQQTATAEILRVISSSPTDVLPVLNAVVTSAARFCGADDVSIFEIDGEGLRLGAHFGPIAIAPGLLVPIVRGTVGGRSVLERRPIHVADAMAEMTEYPEASVWAREFGHRTILSVPLLREGTVVGAIQLRRSEVSPFSDKQIALLQTFGDQAVIAIENVRLFTELGARNWELTVALDQQTATSEILRVISSSQTDVQPVFDAIVRSAVRLCGADHSYAARFDGGLLHPLAFHGFSPEALEIANRRFPMAPSSNTALSRAALTRAVVNVPDMPADPEYLREYAIAGGWRGVLAVPMLRDGNLIGTIAVGRTEPGLFPDQHVELLKTFADQAVIAIENVRLFKELEARNGDLSQALEQQTATAEILRVIGTSPMDTQPVFDAIARNGVRVCGAQSCTLFVVDGGVVRVAATHGVPAARVERFRTQFPMPLSTENDFTQVLHERRIFHLADIEHNPAATPQHIENARLGGYRTRLMVPMMRGESALGLIAVTHKAPTLFPDQEVALLKTFADQAVIAIENVRLFKELQARTSELTRSVEQLTALGEVSRAVSSTLDVETVLDTIVSRASQLAGSDGCAISEYDEATQTFNVRATHNFAPALVETLRAMPLHKGEGAMGRATETGEPIQIADISVPGAYQSPLRDVLVGAGVRALLSVPLLREDQIIGSLSLSRNAPGEFAPEVIEVLKTFATQSALAIQNARLFREIADKSRQLEVASRHKSEFLANMSHELRTPLNAIIGFSEVLNERMFGELNEKQAEYLRDIHASGTHLLSLINDILDLSKIEAGRMELELSDFDLPAALDGAVTLVRERASRRGITLRTAVDGRVGEVRGDERKIRQVTLNLLSNAIKFTPEGGRIEVGAARVDGFVEVSVGDTGVGIAPEDHEAVFEEFRQVGASAAKQEGTGLGLALCRKFVELHGGSIRVTSEVGVGSTFTFTIPVRVGD